MSGEQLALDLGAPVSVAGRVHDLHEAPLGLRAAAVRALIEADPGLTLAERAALLACAIWPPTGKAEG
jgi:hypothetical protein